MNNYSSDNLFSNPNMQCYINENYILGKIRSPTMTADFLGLKREIFLNITNPSLVNSDAKKDIKDDFSSQNKDHIEEKTHDDYPKEQLFRTWDDKSSHFASRDQSPNSESIPSSLCLVSDAELHQIDRNLIEEYEKNSSRQSSQKEEDDQLTIELNNLERMDECNTEYVSGISPICRNYDSLPDWISIKDSSPKKWNTKKYGKRFWKKIKIQKFKKQMLSLVIPLLQFL